MKKIFTIGILLGFTFNSSIFALADVLDEELKNCTPHIIRAKETNNPEDYIKGCTCAYNHPKKRIGEPAKTDFEKAMLNIVVVSSLKRYDTTKKKKYLNLAYKWTREGVDRGFNDMYIISADIILASHFLNKEEMIKAYDLMCKVDNVQCQKDYETFKGVLADTEAVIADRKAEKRQKLNNALYVMGTSLGAGMTSFAQSYSRNMPRYSNSTITPIGNTYYINTYSY